MCSYGVTPNRELDILSQKIEFLTAPRHSEKFGMDEAPLNALENAPGDRRRDNEEVNEDGRILSENHLPSSLRDHPAVKAFASSKASFIVTNPRSPGNPIIYASPAFLLLTGYTIDRVLGRNCRFLQGPETEPAAVATIREAVDNGGDVAMTLLNYRSDGTTFWNQVIISSVWQKIDDEKRLTYFIGLQNPSKRKAVTEDGHIYEVASE